jgi:lipopolysaccharide transport system ATP-binding protein
MNDSVIIVENLSKRYRIGRPETKAKTLAGQIMSTVKAPLTNFRRLANLSKFGQDDATVFWALRDVNFEVKQGDVLGVIGANGAGKSTLLKILSRITDPTSGQVKIKGRVAALLEVGTGFHPELTGRENIYMNGTILGMTHKEISKKFDEIVDFSGVEKFIDTPVKFYSSGMKVRLGFAVAAHLEPEILIIDEVLAVGDSEFQKKCMGKMDDVAHKEGRTILFVSHNMAAIRSLCNKGILLRNGQINIMGSTDVIVSNYLKGGSEVSGFFELGNASPEEKVIIKKVILRNQHGAQTQNFEIGDDLTVELHYYAVEKIDKPYFFMGFKGKFGAIGGANSLLDGHRPLVIEGSGIVQCTFKNLPLLPQEYTLSAGIRDSEGRRSLTVSKDIGYFNILTKVSDIGFNGFLADSLAPDSAPVLLSYSWQFNDNEIIDVDLLALAKRHAIADINPPIRKS